MVSVGTSIVPPGPRPPPTDTPGTSSPITTLQVTASLHDFAVSLASAWWYGFSVAARATESQVRCCFSGCQGSTSLPCLRSTTRQSCFTFLAWRCSPWLISYNQSSGAGNEPTATRVLLTRTVPSSPNSPLTATVSLGTGLSCSLSHGLRRSAPFSACPPVSSEYRLWLLHRARCRSLPGPRPPVERAMKLGLARASIARSPSCRRRWQIG